MKLGLWSPSPPSFFPEPEDHWGRGRKGKGGKIKGSALCRKKVGFGGTGEGEHRGSFLSDVAAEGDFNPFRVIG